MDAINSLRHIKAEIQPFRRLNLTVSIWLEAFSIIIELSHKILWEEFRIKTNHKGRPRIAAFQYYSSKDHDRPCLCSFKHSPFFFRTCIG